MSEGRGRFQFGLRKLLLWTAAAIFLGFFRSVITSPIEWIIPAWVLAVGVTRVAFGIKAAAALSFTGAGCLTAYTFYLFQTQVSPPSGNGAGLLVGWLVLGSVVLGVVEAVVRAVNWLDSLGNRHD